jgi:hypothetical protein
MGCIWSIIVFNNSSGNCDEKEKRQMKNKFGQFFFKRINTISKYLFWIYFLIILGYYYLLDNPIPIVMSYLFWLLLGFRVGTFLTIKALANNNIKLTDKTVNKTDRNKNAL